MEVLSSSGKRKDHFFQEWKKARGQFLLLLGTHYYVRGIVLMGTTNQVVASYFSITCRPMALFSPLSEGRRFPRGSEGGGNPRRDSKSGKGAGESGGRRGGPGEATP